MIAGVKKSAPAAKKVWNPNEICGSLPKCRSLKGGPKRTRQIVGHSQSIRIHRMQTLARALQWHSASWNFPTAHVLCNVWKQRDCLIFCLFSTVFLGSLCSHIWQEKAEPRHLYFGGYMCNKQRMCCSSTTAAVVTNLWRSSSRFLLLILWYTFCRSVFAYFLFLLFLDSKLHHFFQNLCLMVL